MNQYMVVRNQQVAIEAENPDEAIMKVLKGEGTSAGGSINVQLRPQAQPRQVAGAPNA